MAAQPTFDGLAAVISENAKVLESFLASSPQIPRPSLKADSPPMFPAPPEAAEVHEAKMKLIEATRELQQLALGPIGSLFRTLTHMHELSALHAIYSFEMAKHVPLDGEATFAEVAKAVGLDEDRVTRLIRLAITGGVFTETRPGTIAHTGISAVLATNQGITDIMGMALTDGIEATTEMTNALRKYPTPVNPAIETPFAMYHKIDVPYYQWIGSDIPRLERFQRAMKANDVPGNPNSSHFLAQYPWSSLNINTFVDCGGSMGHSSMRIASVTSIPKFIVQDFTSEEVRHGREALPQEFAGRIEFQEQDFFKPQKVVGADVYFFRWILHNWPDRECIDILKNVVPALKKGSRVIISDVILPEPGTLPLLADREYRVMDIHMLNMFGARERSIDMFKDLFAAADPRFKFLPPTYLKGSLLSIVEAVWDP